MNIVQKAGKRKSAIAKATIKPGKGNVTINNIPLEIYTPELARLRIKEALILAGSISNKIDIKVRANGGGVMSQADAIRLAIGRCLVEYTKDDKLKETFLEYDRQLLVADVRRKETTKPRTHGKARAKRQKSYR